MVAFLVIGVGVVAAVLIGQSGNDSNAVGAATSEVAPPSSIPGSSDPVTDPDPDAGPGAGGPQATGLPEPTGEEVTDFSTLNVGDCVEARMFPEKTVKMYAVDCADATFVLDSVAPSEKCPLKGSAGVRAKDGRTYCFVWVLDVGDCFSLDLWFRASCDVAQGIGPTYTVMDIKTGQTDGTSCQDPDRYVQTGYGDSRGVACYTTGP
jgi:hypothetical protein